MRCNTNIILEPDFEFSKNYEFLMKKLQETRCNNMATVRNILVS
jgi:hypothetical protein